MSEFNLEAWIREMETGRVFHLPPEKAEENIFPYADPMGDMRKATVETIAEEDEEEEEEDGISGKKKKKKSKSKQKARPQSIDKLLPAFENMKPQTRSICILGVDIK